MYPRLTIDLKKLKNNLEGVARITKEQGRCSLMIVTKGVCADREVVKLICRHPAVDFVADSRIQNLETYAGRARKAGKQTVLLRLPMACEIDKVIRFADISFNSELETLKLLNEEAASQRVKHKVVLMIDLGDLREGIFFKAEEAIYNTVSQVLSMDHLQLYGIAVNLTCYGAIIPKHDNLSRLCQWAENIEKTFSIELQMVSGGNSSSIYLIEKGELPGRINNLRLGEAFLLGNDTAYGTKLSGTTDDALLLEAQIIELKEKPSIPIGESGVDAFGKKPVYEDRGKIKRAIIAIGQQDTDITSMKPLDSKVDILGASSDHMILDVTKSDESYSIGDVVKFKVGYGAMLKGATSNYVEKVYK
ncbi:MAG: ornithine racemase Orr [Clostridiales Family XIII bacterium]|nr:alanine/ornithine racemase family PLP-dependent enzyme [Anaerovorax odorimutans]MCI7302247.1 ornithine racemase Orr [Clostridia bacterium]MDE8734527.1 ornithine racemase Orr [Eubacteriales bacterium DFI.9.88]MDY3009711.1 ornithine racemase Orr [Clostridiales Family XIII bacterium]